MTNIPIKDKLTKIFIDIGTKSYAYDKDISAFALERLRKTTTETETKLVDKNFAESTLKELLKNKLLKKYDSGIIKATKEGRKRAKLISTTMNKKEDKPETCKIDQETLIIIEQLLNEHEVVLVPLIPKETAIMSDKEEEELILSGKLNPLQKIVEFKLLFYHQPLTLVM